MTRCIIHIGMHKTGSTSIQNSLNGFADKHFMYANLGPANHSLAMYSLFADQPEKHHIHRANKWDAATIQAYNKRVQSQLERAIDEAHGRTLIISGEDIGVLPLLGLEKLRNFLLARFDEIEVVGYVRPPAGFITSGFQQKVISGTGKIVKVDLEKEYRQFQNNFGKFDEVFGYEKVHLWKFDPKSFHEGCAVRDFCRRLGIKLPDARIVRVNESLTRIAVRLLYTYRKFGLDYGSASMKGPESMAIGAQLKAFDNSKFRFSPDVVRPVLEQNRADIQWMEERLGQSLDEDLGEDQPGDVRDESDLLRPDPVAIGKLLALLGDRAPKGIKGETPEEVALLVHALRANA
ncbi:MAG: hypothetical protein KJ850_00385, partial [Gammaproteobacteria bacterium]|nr:hypothetical protein [Gammaproteobacteria bacterium]MBU1981208.1 hypothetical protein [Gammaproteobacteria bacterium]